MPFASLQRTQREAEAGLVDLEGYLVATGATRMRRRVHAEGLRVSGRQQGTQRGLPAAPPLLATSLLEDGDGVLAIATLRTRAGGHQRPGPAPPDAGPPEAPRPVDVPPAVPDGAGAPQSQEPPFDPAVFDELRTLVRRDGRTMLARLLELFLREAPRQLASLASALEAGDLPAVAAAAHALKGSALGLGAGPLAEVSARLEKMGRSGEPDPAAGELVMRARQELDRFRAAVSNDLDKASTGSPT